ncbi:MAG: hypothetical protein ACE5E6_08605 [Phycisphaerae bacterium]
MRDTDRVPTANVIGRGLLASVVVRLVAWVVLVPAHFALGAASPDGERVTITGGADDAAGRIYNWTVTNHHTSPIVYVAFPHYHAGLFFAPNGWSTSETTGLVNVGVPDRPGVCVARATTRSDGIARGASAVFSAQNVADGAHRGSGSVTVRFADGTAVAVGGVEVPQQETAAGQLIPVVGLSLVVVAVVTLRALRRRGAARPDDQSSSSGC